MGPNDPNTNPFARTAMPNLKDLLAGAALLASHAPLETGRATLLSLDACLGVAGLPQSATGQAALLTGQNIPAEIGYHYGPKPDAQVARYLRTASLFHTLHRSGKRTALLNAYPERYFQAIASGRRLYSAIPLAVHSAGIPLKTQEDLFIGQAISADFSGQGWRSDLGVPDAPVLTYRQAGRRLAELANLYDLAFFEYWLSDYAGHRQDMQAACKLLETLDAVLEGLLASWQDDEGLILITSDHGNLEDLGTRRHSANPVPCLLIGSRELRRRFARNLRDITSITPAILEFLNV